MANLDTENKRRSAIPLAPFTIPPVADGTIGTQDRPQAAYMYSGMVYGSPSGITIYNFIDAITGTPWFPLNTSLISKYGGKDILFASNPKILIDVNTGDPYLVINDAGQRFIINILGGLT